MSRILRPLGLATVALLAALPAHADDSPCPITESAQACWQRLTQHPTEKEKTAVTKEATKDLGSKTTGTEAIGGLASTTSDFIAPLAAAIGVSPTTTESGDTAFEKSFYLPTGGKPQKVKLAALLRRPTVYAPLQELLPEATREARVAALQKHLEDFDDVRLAASWNLETERFGRRFGRNERALYVAYFEETFKRNVEAGGSASVKAALEALVNVMARHPGPVAAPGRTGAAECDGAEENPISVPLSCLSADLRPDLVKALVAAAEAVSTRQIGLHQALTAYGLDRFTDLVNNQPQLSVEFAADLRDEIVGPNEWAATARYELGFTNLNSLRDHCTIDYPKERGAPLDADPGCLREYLDQPGVTQSLDRGDRLFFSAELKKRRSYDALLPDDSVHLSLESTWDFVGRFGFGRYLARGDRESRLDLAGEYVYHRDDPNRQNRFVASATYTQRISDTLALAAGFNYSNRPEFLGDVDKKVSAQFGLRYKIVY
jgi:hypothetical protein